MQRIKYKIRINFSQCVDDVSGSGSKKACALGSWEESSECDAQCGPGNRHLQRQYLNQNLARRAGCRDELTRRIPCHGRNCDENFGNFLWI